MWVWPIPLQPPINVKVLEPIGRVLKTVGKVVHLHPCHKVYACEGSDHKLILVVCSSKYGLLKCTACRRLSHVLCMIDYSYNLLQLLLRLGTF